MAYIKPTQSIKETNTVSKTTDSKEISAIPPTSTKEITTSEPSSNESPDTPDIVWVLDADLVSETMEPSEKIHPDTPIVIKTWRIKNSGNCNWPNDTKFTYFSGQLIRSDAKDSTYTVGTVAPGAETTVTIKFSVPPLVGKYTTAWRLQTAEKFFGKQFLVEMSVENKSKPIEPSPIDQKPILKVDPIPSPKISPNPVIQQNPNSSSFDLFSMLNFNLNSKPIIEQPKQVIDAPKPVIIEQPKPIIPDYNPIEQPKQVIDAPKPVIVEQPKQVIDAPKPVIEVPKVDSPKPRTEFEKRLFDLEEMGFRNRDTNIELLIKHKNDMVQVVQELLSLTLK